MTDTVQASPLPAHIATAIRAGNVVIGHRILEKGHLALETVFKYPDGGSIEVCVPKEDLFGNGGRYTLTDFGTTFSWLNDAGVQAWKRPAKSGLLQDAIEPYGVARRGGQLLIEGLDPGSLFDGIIRLSQACLRVADIAYTARLRSRTEFAVRVEEVLAVADFEYETDYEIPLDEGRTTRVDYYVTGTRRNSAILLLSANNTAYAHQKSTDVFTKFFDLQRFRRPEHRMTIWDPSSDVFKEADLERLEIVCSVIPADEGDRIADELAA